jgi:hypothetical protein
MAIAKPIRALLLVTVLLCTFLVYQVVKPSGGLPAKIGGKDHDPWRGNFRDPNIDRMAATFLAIYQ